MAVVEPFPGGETKGWGTKAQWRPNPNTELTKAIWSLGKGGEQQWIEGDNKQWRIILFIDIIFIVYKQQTKSFDSWEKTLKALNNVITFIRKKNLSNGQPSMNSFSPSLVLFRC